MSDLHNGVTLNFVKFNDGTQLSLTPGSILILTGPNNCGKSQCLRDIVFHWISKRRKPIVINEVGLSYQGRLNEAMRFDDLEELLEDNDNRRIKSYVKTSGKDFEDDPFSLMEDVGNSTPQLFGTFIKGFVTYLSTHSRLATFSEQHYSRYDSDSVYNAFTIRDFFEDEDLEAKLYALVSESFGTGVLLNRASFAKARFHFLDKQSSNERNDKGKPSFARWFEEQPKLDQQGDGIIAFCSIVSAILQSQRPLILLDEPEAFLHPPQIRGLAKVIAQELGKKTQLIISTHSHDFIQALIDYETERVSVLRLNRESIGETEVNAVKVLESNAIAELWHDPLLRISDVLTSLFHHVAIIVEGDSDARFFRAMFDVLGASALTRSEDSHGVRGMRVCPDGSDCLASAPGSRSRRS